MPTTTGTSHPARFMLGIEGLAVLRSWLDDPSSLEDREHEIRIVLSEIESDPQAVPVLRYDPAEGYERWAPSYDGPNPLIQVEEPAVRDLLRHFTPGDALDTACGTGRHAAYLAELGHRVLGVDASEEMLAIASGKLPGLEMRKGSLESLPVEDASYDLAVCALSLTHLNEITPAVRELARALRPGAHLVISDVHPLVAALGGGAVFGVGDEAMQAVHYVPNVVHPLSSYLAAFRAAHLRVVDCIEPVVNESVIEFFPGWDRWPDTVRRAFGGLPFVIIWELRR